MPSRGQGHWELWESGHGEKGKEGLRDEWAVGECEDGLAAEAGQRTRGSGLATESEYRTQGFCALSGSEYSCSEQHLAPTAHETLFSSHCIGKQTVHVPLMAKKDASESQRLLSLLSWSRCNLHTEAWVLSVGRTCSYVG